MTETFLLLRIRREACVWWCSWVGTDGVRRENVDARAFLAVGVAVMPISFLCAEADTIRKVDGHYTALGLLEGAVLPQ